MQFTKQLSFDVAPRHTRQAGLLSRFYFRWRHHYCLTFIFHSVVYKAGVSCKESCHIISRHLACFGPQKWWWGPK